MTYASYRLHRKNWLLWSWVAEYGGHETGKGFAMSETSARWAARSWLRTKGESEPDQIEADTEARSPPH